MEKVKTDSDWQKALLPYMKYMLIGFSLFFFIATTLQLFYLHREIKYRDDASAVQPLNELLAGDESSNTLEKARLLSLVGLERDAMKRRYHQANVLLMSRIWIKYLGFLTGMILALAGSVFILGKMDMPESKLDTETNVAGKISLTSASPGLFLVLFGVILMSMTIFRHNEISVKDASVYYHGGVIFQNEGDNDTLTGKVRIIADPVDLPD